MLKPSDPYFMFWQASMRPVLGGQAYWRLIQHNQWLMQVFPNFEPINRHATNRRSNFLISSVKFLLETLLWVPGLILEPILRRIHINHTFKLAENRAVTSSTIANAGMLKLHGYDVRAEIAQRYNEILISL